MASSAAPKPTVEDSDLELDPELARHLATIEEAKAAACKQTDEARRAAVLDELTAEAQKLGLGY